jgi:hypothetical protein
MGLLSYFPIQDYISKYNIKTLVETGSGYGTGIKTAQKFKELLDICSCEIDLEQAENLKNEFSYDYRVSIFAGNSNDYLNSIFANKRFCKEKSILFWLDSHFPMADLGKARFDDEKNLDIRLPLEKELDTIRAYRNPNFYQDVIIIDDWRIYEKMDFHGGDLEKEGYGHIINYNTSFIEKWNKTHTINKIKTDTGYLELVPIQVN